MYTSILRRILKRLIKVRQTLLYKYINLYPLKTVSLFTFHSLFCILKYHIYAVSRNPENPAHLWFQAHKMNGLVPVLSTFSITITCLVLLLKPVVSAFRCAHRN